jgi:lysozyme family protein
VFSGRKLQARFQPEKLGAAYTWEVAKSKYDKILQTYKILRFNEAHQTAERIIPFLSTYRPISDQTNIPVAWLAAINERESSTNFHTYFGNGDPLNQRTRHVPAGRGPFSTWAEGCLDALHQMGLVGLANWTLDFFCYQSERYNGFGYEEFHNEISPYVVGGTSLQTKGKYTADGHFNPYVVDTQLGTLAIYSALIAQIPTLAIPIYG